MKIKIITQEQLIEGIIASICFPLTIMFFRHNKSNDFIFYSSIGWFITWIARKFGVNIYLHLKEKYKWENRTYYITI
tara:strand:- start:18 stop:248 length:231 start_codon:yes stop_codon:yes gene_type:complete